MRRLGIQNASARTARARARRAALVDPGATRDAVLKLVDSPNPPLRLFLGEAPPPQAGSPASLRRAGIGPVRLAGAAGGRWPR